MRNRTGKQWWKKIAAIICSITMLVPPAAWIIPAAELVEDAPTIMENIPEEAQSAEVEAVPEEMPMEEIENSVAPVADSLPEEVQEEPLVDELEETTQTIIEEPVSDAEELPEEVDDTTFEEEAESALIEEEVAIEEEKIDSEAKDEATNTYKTFILNGEEDVQFELKPEITGVYEFAFPEVKEGYESVGYSLYSGKNELVNNKQLWDIYNDNYPSFMMEAGKNYILTIHARGYVGELLLNRMEEDPFTIDGTTLTDIALNNVVYLILPEGITDISSSAYNDICWSCNIDGSILFPSTISKISAENISFGYSNLINLYVADGNEIYSSEEGVLFTDTGETLVKVPSYKAAGKTYLVPGNPTTIGDHAFCNSEISEVILPDSVEFIKDYAFALSDTTSVILSSGLKEIGESAFWGTELTSIELPETLTSIGERAFYDTGLTEIELPVSLEEVFSNSFEECSSLKKLTINTNCEIENMLQGMNNLEEIILGKEVTRYSLSKEGWLYELNSQTYYVGENIFSYPVYGDVLLFIPGLYETEVLDFSRYVRVSDRTKIFSHVKGVKKLIIGANTVGFPRYSIALPDLEEITVAEGNPVYFSQDGVLYYKNHTVRGNSYVVEDTLICYPSCKEVDTFKVPDFVDIIAGGAFENYSDKPRSLTSITIPLYTNFEETYGEYKYASVFSTENESISEPVLTIRGYSYTDAHRYYLSYQQKENLAWEFITCTVTLDPAKGKVSKTELTVIPGEDYGTLPTPKRDNYYFYGWYNSEGERITASTMVWDESDHTLTAKWKKAEIGNTTVTVKNCTWNGKAQKPAVTVKLAGRTLKENTHYTLTYSKNKEPGTGKVVVKGIGIFRNSAKTKTATFTISKKAQTITASVTINKKTQAITASSKTFASSEIGKQAAFSASVKEKAKLTYTSSNKNVIKVVDKNTGKIKIVGPGIATITIKAAATSHYKSASKKITIKVKGEQKIELTASFLIKGSTKGKYELRNNIISKSLGVKVKGKAAYTCRVSSTGKGCLAWFTSGDKLTTEGAGIITITVTAKATDDGVYPKKSETYTLTQKGMALTSSEATMFTYRQIDANNVAIVKYLGNATKVNIPFTVTVGSKTKNITAIDANAFASKKMTTLTMKSGSPLKVIGTGAFKNCASLKELRLGMGITSIGKQAFYGCKSLTSVTFPDGIKTIGAEAFSGTALSDVLTLPYSLEKINAKAFYGCSKINRLVVYGFLKTVGANAFAGCSGITDVYYSGPDYYWKVIDFATGNTTVTGAAMHFNAGAPPAVYNVTDITDKMLLNNYPEALDNESYEAITTDLEDELLNIMISHSSWDEGLAALKTEFSKGYIYTLIKLFEDAVTEDGGRTWTEEQVDRALALELLREASDVDQINSEVGVVLDEVYSKLKELKPVAEKLVTDDKLCTEVAEQLYDLLKDHLHYSKADYKKMLKTIGKYWKKSKDHPEVTFSITDAFDAVDAVIYEADFIMDIITLMIIGEESVDRALAYAPEESALYDGFLQLRVEMELPMETMILRYLTDEFLGELAKTISSQIVGSSGDALFTVSKGTIAAASTFYKMIGMVMDCPTIDSYNNAWISVRNTVYLHQIVQNLQEQLVLAKNTDNTKFQNDYIYFVNMYFASLKSSGKYVASTMKDHDYLDQKMNRYKDSFTLPTFLRSCKENVVAVN